MFNDFYSEKNLINKINYLTSSNHSFLSDDIQPRDFFNSKLIILGSINKPEIRLLAKTTNIVAIVDDELSKKQRLMYGINVVTSEEWISLALADKSIISCLLVATSRATIHFQKNCIQYKLRYITPIQLLLILEKQEI
jgi:FlaA1/EpsC-like NDP-sugar epimerase